MIESCGFHLSASLRARVNSGRFSMSRSDLKCFQDAIVARKQYDMTLRGVLGGPVPHGHCKFFFELSFIKMSVIISL
jgi:hypothetical protein